MKRYALGLLATAVFQLRHGGAEAAARLFEVAHDLFDDEGLTREARAMTGAEVQASAALGRIWVSASALR